MRLLGEPYVTNVRQWRDTFESFLSVYTDHSVRRSERLNRFNQLFRAMFIDRHPAYQLYRHWYNVTEHSPEFPAPPTSEPIPHEAMDVSDDEYRGTRYADRPAKPGFRLTRNQALAVAGGGIIVVVIGALIASGAFNQQSGGPDIGVTITDTPTTNLTQTSVAEAANATGTANALPTSTLDPARVTPTLPPQDIAFITPTILPTGLPGPTDLPRPTASPSMTNTPAPTATPSNTPTNTATFTPTATPTPTLPPQGLQGEQDLLAVLNRVSDYPWDAEQFSPGGDFWRLGVGEDTGGDTLLIALPADLLETYFGNNAATRIRRLEAEVTLTTYNPSLLATNEVYFGVLLQSATNLDQTVGMHVQLVQPGVVNLGLRSGDDVQVISQRSVNAVIVRVRLERDEENGEITVFFNGEQIGDPLPFAGPEAPILPVLFVKEGGVIVSVSEWAVTLR
jgi:hypothetical protein